MSTQIQRRRGTTTEHNTFTGVEGELTVDTTKDTVVVHDGATTGGRPLLREDQANLPTSVTNGISVPSANNVAISTNGTGRLFINSSGQVGIGTSSQNRALVISSADSEQLILSSTSGSLAGIFFNPNGTTYTPYFGATSNDLVAQTQGLERVRITSDGKLGLGTSSPQRPFDVVSNSSAETATFRGRSSDNIGTIRFSSNDAGTNYASIQSRPAYFEIGTSSSIPLVLAPGSGTGVGIGTASPGRQLDVNSTAIFDSNGDGSTTVPSIAIGSTGTGFSYIGSQQLAFITNSTERLRITSDGKLGLGTSSASQLFHLARPAGATIIELQRTDANTTGATGVIQFNANDDHAIAAIAVVGDGDDDGGHLTFRTTSTASANSYFTSTEERVRITSTGAVGIGTTSPGSYSASGDNLVVADAGNCGITLAAGTSSSGQIFFADGTSGADNIRGIIGYTHASNDLFFGTNAVERARIDSSGRLLVGTSTARSNIVGITPNHQFEVVDDALCLALVSGTTNASSPELLLAKHRGTTSGSSAVVINGDNLGSIKFTGADGANFIQGAAITALVDGTPGSNDMPSRLEFSTTADGASSPTERMRIDSRGFLKASNNASFVNLSGEYHEFCSNTTSQCVIVEPSNASYASRALEVNAIRAANSAYGFFRGTSGDFSDTEFNLRGDGNAYADGTWSGGGADYAEYFEWSDGNTTAEDRRGTSVVLDGDKIREAVAGEEPIGVISGNPSVVGDADIDRWKGKYLRDDFGTYIWEDYEVEDEDGNSVTQQRRKLNPDYDPDVEYVSREDRPEWDCVGLMGKLRIRKGQPTGSRWIKMRDISDSVEEWLVR